MEPDEKMYSEDRSAFVSELLDSIHRAKKSINATSTTWSRNEEGERSAYLSQHELGSAEADDEPSCAPPWRYMPAVRILVEGILKVTRMYLKTLGMTKWHEAFNKMDVHGHAELVSLPGDVPPVEANKVRKVCMGNHDKPKLSSRIPRRGEAFCGRDAPCDGGMATQCH